MKDRSIEEIIQEIGARANIYFSYSSQNVPVEQKISIKVRKKPVHEILDLVLKTNGIDYFIIENQVVLRSFVHPATKTKEIPSGNEPKFTVSGFIKDRLSGEMLIGAHVYDDSSFFGTSTNGYGFYSLTLPAGKYQLQVSFVGYHNVKKELVLFQDKQENIEMGENRLPMKEIEIIASGMESTLQVSLLSEFRFSQKTLSRLPGFAGDLDIIKSLQVVPGIEGFGDGSTRFFVRGGNSDQNLILVDEAPIYNPSHVFGFFSAITPDAINDVVVYKGDFPSEYGGRLSSVIDIKTKNGNMNRIGFGGNIGPFASTLTLEGPIVKEKSSFYLSGRISTLQWLPLISSELATFNIRFFDVNAKLNLKLNEKNRVFVTFYTGGDNLSRITNSAITTYGISWNNILGAIRWNHVFTNRLFSNTTAYYSQYNYFLYLSEDHDDSWNSRISNLTLKSDLTWFLNPRNTLKGGLEIGFHTSNPGNVSMANPENQNMIVEVPKYSSIEYVFYLGNEQSIGNRINLHYGIRVPVWQDIGPTTVYSFNQNYEVIDTLQVPEQTTYAMFIQPEPRVNFSYSWNGKSVLKAGYTRTTQFLQVVTNSVSPFTSLEVWAPSGPNIKPQIIDQISLGYFQKIFSSKIILSIEGFYKWFTHYLDYEDHANLLYNPLMEGELRTGKARSFGVECLVRKTAGNFTGWIGYTFSRMFVQTEGVNGGLEYPAFQDRPHNFLVNVSYQTTNRWFFSANWIFLSGGAITTPIGFYMYNGTSVPIYGEKNNDRLPDYHRLDLSVSFRLNRLDSKFRHRLIFTLYNAYGRLNPFSISFNKMENDDENFVVPSDMIGTNYLVPTTLSASGMIPSLNYQFNF